MNTRALAVAGAAVGGALLARSLIRRYTAYDLHDRVALVAGGARGLGLQVARELAARGARLAICARDPDDLATARTELLARGARVVALPCDVTDRAQLTRLVADVYQQVGLVDVLVTDGSLQVIEEVLPAMRERGEGRIIHLSSAALPPRTRADLAREGIALTTVIRGPRAVQTARTARRIVHAMCHGDRELVLSSLSKRAQIEAGGVTGAGASW